MHEMALASSVVEAIEKEAALRAFTKVDRIVLEIGALSCVDTHAMEFGFDAVSRGTCAEGAKLDFVTPPGAAQCFGCGEDVEIARKGDPCPKCGSHQLVVTGGEELKIKSLEVV